MKTTNVGRSIEQAAQRYNALESLAGGRGPKAVEAQSELQQLDATLRQSGVNVDEFRCASSSERLAILRKAVDQARATEAFVAAGQQSGHNLGWDVTGASEAAAGSASQTKKA